MMTAAMVPPLAERDLFFVNPLELPPGIDLQHL